MSEPFSEQLRQAIKASGMSAYAVNFAAGVDRGTMSRFLAGKGGLSLATVDRLVAVLGLKLVADSPKNPRRAGGGTAANDSTPLDPDL